MSEHGPASSNLPLAGITVVDLGQVYQGPYATLLMAKAGADIIKVEPLEGEPARRRAGAGSARDRGRGGAGRSGRPGP
ncbi:MAG: CoA transferase, partial [Sulfurifustaceae bacterium]